MNGDRFEQLATLVGVADHYHDVFGTRIAVDAPRRAEIMRRLGFPSATEVELGESLEVAGRLKGTVLPTTVVVTSRRASGVQLHVSGPATWHLREESGRQRDGRSTDGRIDLPPLPPGYHALTVETAQGTGQATIISAPERCRAPAWMREGGRAWGLAAQVYSLRSDDNLGIGSYGDVRRAVEGAASLGASFLGLSPTHALFEADRSRNSPYSPSSRLFLETLHIDPRALPGFAGSAGERCLEEGGRQARIEALRAASLVDHAGVWAELSPVLEAYFAERREALGPSLDGFRRKMGETLQAHAVYEALFEHFRTSGHTSRFTWPDAFQRRDGQAVTTFAREHEDRVAYHAWLQMVADAQLRDAHETALAGGMSIGLYRDLAVGPDRDGSEVWASPDAFGSDLSVGAPPDLLAPQGQDWGLPPLHPLTLEASGLAAFCSLVQANMRHAGAIRIDHAFQLQRLYLIPSGEGGAAGAYVSYPFEAMLAVLRLESYRAKALVIAEDLGTAPAGFAEAIMDSGILSYRVLAFERGEGGAFLPPAAYPRDAMAAVSTHDLPTLLGWWRGLDTDLRQGLGLYEPDRAEIERAERVRERGMLTKALHAEGLLPDATPPESVPADAVVRYLARTPSVLNVLQYEDVAGALNQANLPGTTEGHPNWRRKLEVSLDTIAAPGGPLAKVAALLAQEGRGPKAADRALASPPPRATYRLQFHKDFTFDHAVAIVPYLAKLGVSHVYASPIQKARPGSTHGYDIVEHAEINPELGGEEGFARLSDALRAHGLGLILDIVPNHMGVGGADNEDWLSVLEWGALSPRGSTFDIDWERLGAGGKLVIPVLGERYGEALEHGTLELRFEPRDGSFSVHHYEHRLPLSPLSYPLILDRALMALDDLRQHEDVIAVSEALRLMSEETDPARRADFPAKAAELKARLARAVAASPDLLAAMGRAAAVLNGIEGVPESFGTLHRILEMQSYRPAHWRVAASDINYRRFFDINGLAGVRVEEPAVYERTHQLMMRLVREGRIQGLRIDHVDGLADPAGYLEKLQADAGPGFFILVEKILEPGEALREWPVSGTTGYDVLNLIDGVLVQHENKGRIEEVYREFSGETGRYFDLLRGAKAEILQGAFASELEVLVSDLKRVADADRRTRDYTVHAMRIALSEIIARFPVYRSYITDDEPSLEDVELIEDTIAAARQHSALPDHSVHDFTAECLLGRVATSGPGRPAAEHVARFRRRFQQLTGPVMAKSLEDTLFYRYAPLLALNEVGGDPAEFGCTAEHFHHANAERARTWPDAMIATATHDTKRGEDARARLLAIAEIPDEWAEMLRAWSAFADERDTGEGEPAPDANDRVIVLQTILGAFPPELLEEERPDEAKALSAFTERLDGYVEKALREAKRHSSWVNVDEAYEAATKALVAAALAPDASILPELRAFARRLAMAGSSNGLARTVLKLTLPGVPDFYQGTEYQDFSMVDPDNRRPVDYRAREASLGSAPAHGTDADRTKQAIVSALLADRGSSPELYARGDYRPLRIAGDGAEAVIAFARREGEAELVTAVRRFTLGQDPHAATVMLPSPGAWHDTLSGRTVGSESGEIAAGELFATLPVAVLRRNG